MELCLRATGEDIDTAVQLIWLLTDMHEMGPIVAHSPIERSTSDPSTHASYRDAVGPNSVSSPSNSSSRVTSQPAPLAEPWTKVTHRPRPNPAPTEMDPLAAFIPAYKNMPIGWRANTGRTAGEPRLSENLSEGQCRYWAGFYSKKRDEALRDASRYWNKGSRGGGDAALVYADDAREHERRSKAWALKAARAMVDARQRSSTTRNTIDLHGLTVREAVALSHEAVNDWWNSAGPDDMPSNPFTIVTGKGNHSKGKVGVIGPAVENALEAVGWRMSNRPGAIVVTGLKRKRRGTSV